MKRPKMNAYERLMYQMDTTSGHFIYVKIQLAKLFREIGIYRLQSRIKSYLYKIGIDITFKSEFP